MLCVTLIEQNNKRKLEQPSCNSGWILIMVFVWTVLWSDIFVRVSGGETPPFRPPIPPNDKTNDIQLIQLMKDCWDEYSTLRPDFSTIRSRFLVINKGKYDNF